MGAKKELNREEKRKQILEQFEEYIEQSKNPPKKEKKTKNKPKEEDIEVLEIEELEEMNSNEQQEEALVEEIVIEKDQEELPAEVEKTEIPEDEFGNVELQEYIVTPEEKVEVTKKEPEELVIEEETKIIPGKYKLKEPEISKTMFDLDLDDYLERNKIVEEVEEIDSDFWEESKKTKKKGKIHFLEPIAVSLMLLVVFTATLGIAINSDIRSLATNASQDETKVETTEHNVHITKEAEWIAKNRIQYTIQLNSDMEYENTGKDIVIMLDTSTAMKDNISFVIQDITSYIDFLLKENEKNRIALITYQNTATVEVSFTREKEKLETALHNIVLQDGRNYNEALQRLNKMLITYSKEENDLVALLITAGIPSDGNYSVKGSYEIVKDNHKELKIHGIQYELGNRVLEDLKNATDDQWMTNQETFENTLKEASLNPKKMDLEVTEELTEFFNIKDYYTAIGEVNKENNKLIWNLSKNKFATGSTAKLEVVLELKEEYQKKMNQYKISEKTIWNTNNSSKEIELSPTMKNYYEVTYLENTPNGCQISVPEKKQYFVYDIVPIDDSTPSCKGFNFKGWQLSSKEKTLGDHSFVMPAKDVTIRAVWSTYEITSSFQ